MSNDVQEKCAVESKAEENGENTVHCLHDMTLSPSSKSSEDVASSKDYTDATPKRLKDCTTASKLTSPIPLHPSFPGLGSYPPSLMSHLSGPYPFLHSTQLSALSAAMSGGSNPYAYLGSGFNPALLQAVANAGGFSASSRVHSSTSVSNPALANALGSRSYSGSLFTNPQSMSAFNAYAHLLPYGAMAAAASYPNTGSGLSTATGSMELPGRPLSPLSLANRMFKQSSLGKVPNDVSSVHPISGLSNATTGAGSLFSNGFPSGKSRFSPYALPPHFGFNFRPPLDTFNPSEELRHSAFSRQRKASGSISPSSGCTPPASSTRPQTGSNSADSFKSSNRQPPSPYNPSVSSAVQELRNIENMVSGLDRVRNAEKSKVNAV